MILSERTLLGARLGEGLPAACARPVAKLSGWCGGARAAVAIGASDLARHVLFVGASGSGKTNCIVELLSQLKAQMGPRDSMLVFDPKGDFLPFADAADVVISSRGGTACWNLFGEVTADGWDEANVRENAREICHTVFADAIERSSSPFFPKAARDLMADVIAAMALVGADDHDFRRRHLHNEALATYLREADAQRLAEFLGKVPSCSGSLKYLGDGGSDQALGVLAELQEATEALFAGDFGRAGVFSARRFQRTGGGTVFVEYDLARASSPAYQVVVDTYIKEALSPDHDAAGTVTLVIDELKMLPHLLFLENALSFGRSQGVRVVSALQSVEQLYEVYGEVGGRVLAAGFQTLACFSTNNAATREFVQGVCGGSLSELSWLAADGRSRAELRDGHVVEDWDLARLVVGEAVVLQPGVDPFKFLFERYR